MATKAKGKAEQTASRLDEPSGYCVVHRDVIGKCWARALADVSGSCGFGIATDALDREAVSFDRNDLVALCSMRPLTVGEYAALRKSE